MALLLQHHHPGMSSATFKTTTVYVLKKSHCRILFSLALQPQFGPWPTSMKLSVSLRFSRSWTVGRTPWVGDQLVARPLPVHKCRKMHTHTLNIHDLSWIRTHDPGFRASETVHTLDCPATMTSHCRIRE
jgi:hypothetical protein